MEILKPILSNLILEGRKKDFQMNIAKEYLQTIILSYIYSNPKYNSIFFYGGSCLSHCFSLPRLSEDLDFVDSKKQINIEELSEDLKNYFNNNTDLKVETSTQKFRIFLRFPILREIGISSDDVSEKEVLIIKVEIFSDFNFCKKYDVDVRPTFKFNKSILIKTFDLETLMATKIRAILKRKWERKDKKGNILIKVKGRDYYDLLWYLEKGVKPNLRCIEDIDDVEELKLKLLKIVSNIDSQSIKLDLDAFIDDNSFIDNLSENIKTILEKSIKNNL
jgi:predicted nucleotidyltransferase component of viral defense system